MITHEHVKACYATGCPVIREDREKARAEAAIAALPLISDEDLAAEALRRGLLVDGQNEPEAEAAALRRVAALHKSYGIYDECGHDHDEDDEGVVEVDDVGFVCDDGLMYQVCQHCCVTGKHFYDFQTEECVSAHKHGKDEPICATLAAIAGALS